MEGLLEVRLCHRISIEMVEVKNDLIIKKIGYVRFSSGQKV
jgi:hypothetical protein